MHFLKFHDGATIVSRGDMFTHLISIVDGEVSTEMTSDSGDFKVFQTLSAPDFIAPQFFFGRSTRSPFTAVASGNAGILQIPKADFIRILKSDNIFLINFLNILSLHAQAGVDGALSQTTGSLERRIAYRILALTQPGSSKITLRSTRREMHTTFGAPRQSFRNALNTLLDANILQFTESEIHVDDRRSLERVLTTDF